MLPLAHSPALSSKGRFRASLSACVAFALCAGPVDAAPKSRPGSRQAIRIPPATLPNLLAGGRTELTIYGQEFVNWVTEISFYEPPNIQAKARWRLVGYDPASAAWELYKKSPNGPGRITIASGALTNLPDDNTDIIPFGINLASHIPQINTGQQAQEYFLTVFSKAGPSANAVQARRVKIIHLPKSQEQVPAPADPYACSSAAGKDRRVRLEIPKVFVQKTTSTSGDGDRDELYILRARKGPGSHIGDMPRLPGANDYYEAKIGKTLENGPSGSPANIIPWTNQDGQFQSHPVTFSMVMKHGETITVTVTLSEQDNEELADIRAGLITAFSAVAGVASAVGGYGYIVAAAASAAAGASAAIPQTSFHDQIGTFAATFTNKCGYIQTTLVAPKSFDFGEAGTATMNFSDLQTHQSFNQRLTVMTVSDQFWPNGVNWGEFQPTGNDDLIWMDANGTSQSRYTLLVRTEVRMPN